MAMAMMKTYKHSNIYTNDKIKSGAKNVPKAFLAPPREEMKLCVELLDM